MKFFLSSKFYVVLSYYVRTTQNNLEFISKLPFNLEFYIFLSYSPILNRLILINRTAIEFSSKLTFYLELD